MVYQTRTKENSGTLLAIMLIREREILPISMM